MTSFATWVALRMCMCRLIISTIYYKSERLKFKYERSCNFSIRKIISYKRSRIIILKFVFKEGMRSVVNVCMEYDKVESYIALNIFANIASHKRFFYGV